MLFSTRGLAHDGHMANVYDLALMIWLKSGLSDAPPTRKPSMSGLVASSLQFPADTEPVNNTFKFL